MAEQQPSREARLQRQRELQQEYIATHKRLDIKNVIGYIFFEQDPPERSAGTSPEIPKAFYTWINMSMYPRLIRELEAQGQNHQRGLPNPNRSTEKTYDLHVDGPDAQPRRFHIFAIWEKGELLWWYRH